MEKRQKDLIRILVGKLRHLLVGTMTEQGFVPGHLDRELERIGIFADGTIIPLDALHEMCNGEQQTYRIAVDQLKELPQEQRPAVRSEIIERAAYTWINRLLALRTMEVRGLIESTLQADEVYAGHSEKLYLLLLDQPERASEADKGWWAVLSDACRELSVALPGLFSLDDPAAALHPAADSLVHCIELLVGQQPLLRDMTLDELNTAFADPDMIGWAYQFYQDEAKASIDLKCKNGGKATTRAELSAKTQLFTEPYMVQWLLQNSLGCSYHDAYPQSQLPATWPYYISQEQRPNQTVSERIFPLEQLTLLDPCVGSGHFLREALDMFVAMYREQSPHKSAEEIVTVILRDHLFGIDIDPRAAQLAILTLYLRAWELVSAERLTQRSILTGPYVPPTMNIATTPTNLNIGMLQRHLQRHPEDKPLETYLKRLFEGLEQANVLGSLLRSRENIDRAIEALLKPHTIEMDFDPTASSLRELITRRAKEDPIALRSELFERIVTSFRADAGSADDMSINLFGREAEKGVRLLQVLDRRYAVVVTNPPYLSSSYLNSFLKKYLMNYYLSGKRDLYATFILRCIELCAIEGRVAMVTIQNWMFLGSFENLRACSWEELPEFVERGKFKGVLRETSISSIAHLGPNAFTEIGGDVVQSVMFILDNFQPKLEHEIIALRLLSTSGYKGKYLLSKSFDKSINLVFKIHQSTLLDIPGAALVYYLSQNLQRVFTNSLRLENLLNLVEGPCTGDDHRFLHLFWENLTMDEWKEFPKGGGYAKWYGNRYYTIKWKDNGRYLNAYPGSIIPNQKFYFLPGLQYTEAASGSLGVRLHYSSAIPGNKAPFIFIKQNSSAFMGILNCRVVSYFARTIATTIHFSIGTLRSLPLPEFSNELLEQIGYLSDLAVTLKKQINRNNLIDLGFSIDLCDFNIFMYRYEWLLLSLEANIEKIVFRNFTLDSADVQNVLSETGVPVGWYPLISNYDLLPEFPIDMHESQKMLTFSEYFNDCRRISIDNNELTRIKTNLQAIYEAGPGSKSVEQEEDPSTINDEDITASAHIPIPTETFLEELSVKMKLHPISIYWLFEELRAEGARCKPEEQRMLEDRLTVIILRLLGHRWPTQIEQDEPVPAWADSDGIIPLVTGTGERTLAELVRDRLYAEDGAMKAQDTEHLLTELTGKTLEQWLRSSFFPRHIAQFKHRPIAWHLASVAVSAPEDSKGKRKKRVASGQKAPLFECLLYYHASARDALARIRTQYVGPLIRLEEMKLHQRQNSTDKMQTRTDENVTKNITQNQADEKISIDTTSMQGNEKGLEDNTQAQIANEHIHELEAFNARLLAIEEQGFACPDLTSVVDSEPLDRWCSDGYASPHDHAELLRRERSWWVDLNDGVRVNIAPLQLAGVLTKEVLNVNDARKALADRVRWRADERRWVREGKLPRCGWMDEQVPASQAWEDLASQRDNEQARQFQKRLNLSDEGELQDNEQETIEA